MSPSQSHGTAQPLVEVTIEIPRGSFLKRGSGGDIDFISPIPCPFNYGSVHAFIGGEGDYLDAVVLGRRLPVGSCVTMAAWGSVGLSERFMSDDKLICAEQPLTAAQRQFVLGFFQLYALCKGGLNVLRGQRGRARCLGWDDASAAIARALPCHDVSAVPRIGF